MTSLPPLDHALREHSDEEEEELGVLSSSPSSAILGNKLHSSQGKGTKTPAFAKNSSGTAQTAAVAYDKADDEFSLDIPFVTTKTERQCAKYGAFALPSVSSSAHLNNQLYRQDVCGAGRSSVLPQVAAGGLQKKTSIAGRWDSGEAETLNTYKGSDLLDDTDRAKDETEYQAWKQRDARRRKDLLA